MSSKNYESGMIVITVADDRSVKEVSATTASGFVHKRDWKYKPEFGIVSVDYVAPSDIDIELILPHNMYKASKRGEDPLLDRFEQLHLEYIWVFDTDTGTAMFTSNSRKGFTKVQRTEAH